MKQLNNHWLFSEPPEAEETQENEENTELEWWRAYGEYVSRVYQNIDAEACGYADGDNEYKENFNQNSDSL